MNLAQPDSRFLFMEQIDPEKNKIFTETRILPKNPKGIINWMASFFGARTDMKILRKEVDTQVGFGVVHDILLVQKIK